MTDEKMFVCLIFKRKVLKVLEYIFYVKYDLNK